MSVARKLPAQMAFIGRFLTLVLPDVDRELARWQAKISECPESELARQAASSIRLKRFHAQGGSVFALTAGGYRRDLVRLIVALQTISDYLDNLCDRAGCYDRHAFRMLHEAFLCAVDDEREVPDFYQLYPFGGYGGYLRSLVEVCRGVTADLPAYRLVRDDVLRLAELYCDLQVYKHTELWAREPLLISWFNRHRGRYPGIEWWEFAAAAGSTLGIFGLLASATRPELERREVNALVEAYFPYVCGLHILLDYFIDQEEDRQGGDLNFCFYYPDPETCGRRLRHFLAESLERVSRLKRPLFHRTVVKGLLALYLSDPKVRRQGLEPVSRMLFAGAGTDARLMHRVCRALRRVGVV